MGREVECPKEGRGIEEGGEEREDAENVQLGHRQELRRVHIVPVAQFVCCIFDKDVSKV